MRKEPSMTYLALYRKWRPQTFGEIIGQEHIIRTLKNAVESGRTGHAYLFCGTRGTGKTTTAKVLAKALNCPEREGPEPCNTCDSCKNITSGLSVDVIEIDAASNRGIDEIRDLREKIKFAPAMAKFRVYIIDEVHMLTNEAFNALLKTLEEPPRHAVLILATTEPHKVPLTILSRCQRFDFRRIEPADIIKRLKEVASGANLEVEEEALRLIARAAEGGLRDALSILDQGAAFGEMTVTAADVHNILGTVRFDALNMMAGCLAAGETGPALTLVAELASEGKDLRFFAREMAGYLRALLLEKIVPGSSAREAWGDPAAMTAQAAAFSMEGLLRAVDFMAGTEQEMKWSSQPGIILELALVKACRAGVITGESSLLARLETVEEKIRAMGPALLPEGTGVTPVALSGGNKPAAYTGPVKTSETSETSAQPYRHEAAGEATAGAGKAMDGADPGSRDDGVTLERVKEAWVEMMNTMRRERIPLYHNYLKAQPLAVKGGSLVVGFPEGEVLAREMADRTDQKKYLESLLGRFLKGEWQISFKAYQGKLVSPEKRHDHGDKVVDVKRRFGGEEIILDCEDEGSLF
jgi:DNA polymerase-3 subunit gamma/tau